MKTLISFRLRKELDADLINMGIDENDLPDLCRNGLRLMLGIQTTKQFEVKEKPIYPATTQQQQVAKEKAASILPGRPAVFIPQRGV